MKDIFLSRPSWVESKYDLGLSGFTSQLGMLDLSPKTVGTNVFPTTSPMDTVIDLMKKCAGTIVVGYPQITMESGYVKEQKISDIRMFATEWNHIEAALAYSLNMPLLVIHDTSITRGVFDRGALNSFIYSVDMSNKDWFAAKEIQGVLKEWADTLK
ncbi:hypothetical protein [Anaerobium acetethylicum]|uniref:Nucleoside 2-deoxyribosyltransferase n=1 Tax=Anaerobium acetethylicum TaxID=1619234 RepID=A0A1D3TUY1_9FIRM|nr:hypothetical protein [Anaerobium acetethylicum]SCP97907.1 hypothetical protein SAMN05421730_101494 [Anaerobium acetethylicum]